MASSRPGGNLNTDIDTTAIATNRKAYLLSLVPHLSLDEIWILQKSLASLDLRTDIFARLPPELQIIVTDHLGPVDLGCCLQVSSKWRDALLHESMRRSLTRRCFPSLLEYINNVRRQQSRSDPDAATDGDDDAGLESRIFVETARKYALRALGRFRYVFRHCRDPIFITARAKAVLGEPETESDGELTWVRTQKRLTRHQKKQMQLDSEYERIQLQQQIKLQQVLHREQDCPPTPPPALLPKDELVDSDSDTDDDNHIPTPTFSGHSYAYGRIVWQYIEHNSTAFLVDELRTGRRHQFEVQNSTVRGETYLLSAFGDEMLVACTSAQTVAWNFVTGESQFKQLPAQIDTVGTLGRRVCILSQGDIYSWKLGGKLQEVDMTGLDGKHRQPDRDGRLPSYFLLDPINEDVFYLGNYDMESEDNGLSGALCYYLHRFEGLRYKETFSHQLPFNNFALPSRIVEATVRRDSHGLYSLASWRVDTGTPGSIHTWPHNAVDCVGSLSFNIYTKEFSLSYFRLPPQVPNFGPEHFHSISTHIWNDQLITLVDRFRDGPSRKIRPANPLLFAFEDENGEDVRCSTRRPFSSVPLYTSRPIRQAEEAGNIRDDRGAIKVKKQSKAAKDQALIEPECRQKVPFNMLGLGTPGVWLQDDADWEKNKCSLRFALDVNTSPSQADSLRPAHIRIYHMQGDDDFLVMFHDGEYTVWIFSDDVDPSTWSAYT